MSRGRKRKPSAGIDDRESGHHYMAEKRRKTDIQFSAEFEKFRDPETSSIFNGVTIWVDGHTDPPAAELRRLMGLHGGHFVTVMSKRMTHIVCQTLPKSKIEKFRRLKNKLGKPVVLPTWVTESVKHRRVMPTAPFILPGIIFGQGQLPVKSFGFGASAKTPPKSRAVPKPVLIDFEESEDDIARRLQEGGADIAAAAVKVPAVSSDRSTSAVASASPPLSRAIATPPIVAAASSPMRPEDIARMLQEDGDMLSSPIRSSQTSQESHAPASSPSPPPRYRPPRSHAAGVGRRRSPCRQSDPPDPKRTSFTRSPNSAVGTSRKRPLEECGGGSEPPAFVVPSPWTPGVNRSSVNSRIGCFETPSPSTSTAAGSEAPHGHSGSKRVSSRTPTPIPTGSSKRGNADDTSTRTPKPTPIGGSKGGNADGTSAAQCISLITPTPKPKKRRLRRRNTPSSTSSLSRGRGEEGSSRSNSSNYPAKESSVADGSDKTPKRQLFQAPKPSEPRASPKRGAVPKSTSAFSSDSQSSSVASTTFFSRTCPISSPDAELVKASDSQHKTTSFDNTKKPTPALDVSHYSVRSSPRGGGTGSLKDVSRISPLRSSATTTANNRDTSSALSSPSPSPLRSPSKRAPPVVTSSRSPTKVLPPSAASSSSAADNTRAPPPSVLSLRTPNRRSPPSAASSRSPNKRSTPSAVSSCSPNARASLRSPAKAPPSRSSPSKAPLSCTSPSKASPSRTSPSKAPPSHTSPSKAPSSRTSPNRTQRPRVPGLPHMSSMPRRLDKAPEQPTSSGHSGASKGASASLFNRPNNDAPPRPSSGPHSTLTDPNFVKNFFEASRLHFIGSWKRVYEDLYPQFLKIKPRFPDSMYSPHKVRGSEARYHRTIMHIDMDCFFASVAIRDNPHLKGKPIAVSHSRGSRKATSGGYCELASVSYEARKFGIKNGMGASQALELCPQLITVPYSFDQYAKVSRSIYRIFFEYTHQIECGSCDEAFLELPSAKVSGEQADAIGEEIRQRIFKETGCSASVGIGTSVLLARLASRRAKPDGLHRLKPVDQCPETGTLIDELPVGSLPGVGWALKRKLADLSIEKAGQLREHSVEKLRTLFGFKTGQNLHDVCRGVDDRALTLNPTRKSIGAEISWGVRFKDIKGLRKFIDDLSQEVEYRIREAGVRGKHLSLALKIKHPDAREHGKKHLGHGKCNNATRSVSLPTAIDDWQSISREIRTLYERNKFDPKETRGVGIHVSKLVRVADSSSYGSIADMFGRANKASGKQPSPPPAPPASSSSTPKANLADAVGPVRTETCQPVGKESALSRHLNKTKPSRTIHVLEEAEEPSPTAASADAAAAPKVKQPKLPDDDGIDESSSSRPEASARQRAAVAALGFGGSLPPFSQLDRDAVTALPLHIRKELADAYKAESMRRKRRTVSAFSSHFMARPKAGASSSSSSFSSKSFGKSSSSGASTASPETSQEQDRSDDDDGDGDSIDVVRRKFVHWIRAVAPPGPTERHVAALSAFVCEYIDDEDAPTALVLLKYLRSHVSAAEDTTPRWRACYSEVLGAAQSAMKRVYGGPMLIL